MFVFLGRMVNLRYDDMQEVEAELREIKGETKVAVESCIEKYYRDQGIVIGEARGISIGEARGIISMGREFMLSDDSIKERLISKLKMSPAEAERMLRDVRS